MNAMIGGPAHRRGSFLETMAMFAGGRAVWLGLLTFGGVAIASLLARTAGVYFFGMGVMVAFWFSMSTVIIEGLGAPKLAFLALVPHPVDNKWLVLAPGCAGAIVPAVVQAVFGKLPAVSSLPMLGCALWTVGAMRWLRYVPVAFGLPLLALAPVAAWGAYSVGGWGAASVAALALGIVAIAFQGPLTFEDGPRWAQLFARVRDDVRIPREAASRADRERAAWLASAVRFLLICTAQLRRFKLVAALLVTAFALIQPLPGPALFIWIPFVPWPSFSQTYSHETFEFLRPLPFSRWRRFFGGAVIPLIATLAAPLVMTAYVDLDWINHEGWSRWLFKSPHAHQSTLAYLREIMGATFLPEKWPAGGLPPEVWPRLRPLLWLDLLRIEALLVAVLFGGGAMLGGGGALGGKRWLPTLMSFAFVMVVYFASVRLVVGSLARIPLTSHGFAFLLAALAIAYWTWRVRVVNSPEGATGSSMRG